MGISGETPKGLEGDKSGLFYHYLRILNEVKEYNGNVKWLLENVRMKKNYKEDLDNYLGVIGVLINSKDFSYQRRPRLYWTNLKIHPWKDKMVSFQDYKEVGEGLDSYKVNKTPSRIKMWSDGNGVGNSNSCANVTYSDKIYCLTTKQERSPNSGLVEYDGFCRYLTRGELEQAQTVPVGYTKILTYNQAQTVLGNGWTVDVICHILKDLV